MSDSAEQGWVVEVRSVIPGGAPFTMIFCVGFDTEPEAEDAVRNDHRVEPGSRIKAVKPMSAVDISLTQLKRGQVKQWDGDV